MKLFMIALSTFGIVTTLSSAQAQELSADACRPLTDSNRTQCCSASNWKDVVLPNEQVSCAQSNKQGDKNQQTPGDTTGSITSPSTTDDGGGTTTPGGGGEPAAQSGGANPGNDNDVGGAGEKGMNTESPSSGTRGNSN
jgi:hypothetical protein